MSQGTWHPRALLVGSERAQIVGWASATAAQPNWSLPVNVAATTEAMATLRKSLLAVEEARASASALVKAAAKAPAAAATMTALIQAQAATIIDALKAAAAEADKLAQAVAAKQEPEPKGAAAKK